jgi:5'-3' exonuclease
MGDVIADACRNYVQGLQWVVDCYFHHTPHRGWYYKHAYSPTILDLFNYLTCEVGGLNEAAILSGFDSIVIGPDELDLQLLCILPPSSAHLIQRPELQRLYSDVGQGCVHMFPRSFDFQTYMKKFTWECHPKIPVPDVARLRNAMLRSAISFAQ